MLRCLFVILSLFAIHGIQAMSDEVVFDMYEWNFGKINEADGTVSHTFYLTNKGKKNLLITKVVASCSCVSVDYPRNPIKSGTTEELTVSFSPSGAVGPVFRSVEVFSSDNVCVGTLEISADITPVDRTIQERYHNTLADFLYANLVKIPFGYIYHGEQRTKSVFIANTSSQLMTIATKELKGALQITHPDVLGPGEEREIFFTYSSPDDPTLFATFADTVFFIVNGQQANVPITTSMYCLAKIEESPNSPQMRTYPSYGEFKRKTKKSYVASLDIFNDGQSNLIIYKVEVPDLMQVNIAPGHVVETGGKAKLEITAASPTPFLIKLFTNDPQRPVKEINIKSTQ